MRRLLHLLALAGCAGGLDLRPFVVIAEPAADAVVYGAAEAPAPDARNLRTVRIVLHYYDLPPDPSALGLWIRFDRGEATVMGPPLPSSALEVSLRLGTHVVEVAVLEGARVDEGRVASVVFDLAPRPGERILRDVDEPFGRGVAAAPRRPSEAPFAHGACVAARGRPIRVVLVGSLQLGGQSMLALEQARRLPRVLLPDGSKAFDLVFASTAGGDAAKQLPLEALLEDLDIRVERYAMEVPLAVLDAHGRDDVGASLALALAAYESRADLPDELVHAVGDLLDIFAGADVVSFTNHENFRATDRAIVECARLAGVPSALNEPANLWWGSLPTGAGAADATPVAGLVLPSGFAARFWASRGAAAPLYVVPPGITLDGAAAAPPPRRNGSRPLRIGFVSRLAPQKSPGLFVRAAAAVAALYADRPASASFVVLGDGPLRAALEGLAARLGLRVTGAAFHDGDSAPGAATMHFAGWLAPEHVRAAIATTMDVVVHSNVLEETFCMCNVEAMAEAVPVVSFGVGGVSEYLGARADHGTIVKTPSVAALVAALVDAIEDPAAAAARGARAARRVRGLDGGRDLGFDRMALQYADLYGSLACAAPRPSPAAAAAAAACGDDGARERSWYDSPAELLDRGDAWAAACALSRYVAGDAERAWTAPGLERSHLLVMVLLQATGVFVSNVAPAPGSREGDALLAAAELAEAAAAGCDGLGAANRSDALLNLAGVARVARAGTPDLAAAAFGELLRRRRRVPAVAADFSRAALLESLVSSVVPARANFVEVALGDEGRSVRMAMGGLPLYDRPPGARRAFGATPAKLRHNAAQYAHLAALADFRFDDDVRDLLRAVGLAGGSDGDAARKLAGAYARVADRLAPLCGDGDTDTVSLLSLLEPDFYEPDADDDARFLAVLATLDAAAHVFSPAALAAPAVRRRTLSAGDALDDGASVLVLDDVFSDDALALLRRQLVESTVWYDVKRGHLGAYLEDGLASGLLLQVVDELQALLEPVIGKARLVQAWGYKYHGHRSDMGIRPHADEGAFTVNCWVTADEHNLVDGSGGLRVYGASVPDHVPFPEANRDFRAVRRHVAGAAFVDVDHKSNRCVVFRSKLVHETRPFYFRRDYGAYRINLTFMYGTSDWSSAWKGKGNDDDPRMYDAPG